MEQLHLEDQQPPARSPLSTYEPVETSARPNSEIDDEEVRARLPVLVVLFVVVMTFVLVSARAGLIAAAIGTFVLVAQYFLVFRN